MKKKLIISIFAITCLIGVSQAQTPISPYLIGNNYWIPGSTVTELMKPGGLMAQSKIQTIRIGGFGPNNYSDAQYLEYIKRIIAMGAKPIVQVKATLTAQEAIAFITFINVTNNQNVRIWSIGNEPDHTGGGYLSDAQVSDYTKRIAAALKSVDPTIMIVGAEYAGYDAGRYANLIGGANSITGPVPGKDYYYIDVIGFHKYAATGLADFSGSINDLTTKITGENLKRPAGKKLQWSMGEFNSHWNNDETTNPDMKVWSFNNGQMHAELYGYGMQKAAFTLDSWSMMEGELNRAGTDLSLFDKDFTPRSSYWHSAMLAQNLKNNYLQNTDNQSTVAVIPMGDATGTAVMIVNKNKTSDYQYTLKLDMNAATPNSLTINVNAGINKEVTGNIGAVTTVMLFFNTEGNLTKTITYSKADADIRKAPTVFNIPIIPIIYNHILPKKVEAEQYNINVGLVAEPVTASEGPGQDLGYTDAGDYLEYGIEVIKEGNYNLDFRVSSLPGNAGFSVAVDAVIKINELTVPSTGDWQNWITTSKTLALTAGKHTLRITVTKAGFNLNWIDFKQSTITGIEDINSDHIISVFPQPFTSFANLKMENGSTILSFNIFNAAGQLVETLNGNKTSQLTFGQNLPTGAYQMLVQTSEGRRNLKIVKQ